MILRHRTRLLKIMQGCMEDKEIDNRATLLKHLNNLLPSKYRTQMPSLITNKWIDNYLYSLEEKFV
jgi:hypothetical protein